MPLNDPIRTISHLTAIIDAMPTAVVMVDRAGRIVLTNKQAGALFGYSRDEMIDVLVEMLIPQRYRDHHPALREKFHHDPQARPMGAGRDLFGLRKDGSEFPIEIGLNPIHTEQGDFVLAAIIDLTERKRSEAYLAAVIDALPTAIIMVDRQGQIVLTNTNAEVLFGYTREELAGLKVEALIPERFRTSHPALRESFHKDPQTRPMGAGRDLFGLRKDGSEFPIEIGLNPIDTDRGQFILAAIVNITERKRSEAHLKHMNEALERSNLELQQFAYIASHDLQSPLRGISGFAQLLQSQYLGKLDAQADDYISRMVNSTKRMQTLIHDLLSYSRVDSRARPFSPVDCNEVVDDVIQILDPSIRDAGAKVTRDELPVVEGDRSQLAQLMQNLIGNAIKYHSGDPPRIHVSADKKGDAWVFSVSDNGIGIEAKHTERIFEIFCRLHTQQAMPGTGIGLAVCRRVVHRHGGRIWAESEPGRGSTFYFTIPDRSDEP